MIHSESRGNKIKLVQLRNIHILYFICYQAEHQSYDKNKCIFPNTVQTEIKQLTVCGAKHLFPLPTVFPATNFTVVASLVSSESSGEFVSKGLVGCVSSAIY